MTWGPFLKKYWTYPRSGTPVPSSTAFRLNSQSHSTQKVCCCLQWSFNLDSYWHWGFMLVKLNIYQSKPVNALLQVTADIYLTFWSWTSVSSFRQNVISVCTLPHVVIDTCCKRTSGFLFTCGSFDLLLKFTGKNNLCSLGLVLIYGYVSNAFFDKNILHSNKFVFLTEWFP